MNKHILSLGVVFSMTCLWALHSLTYVGPITFFGAINSSYLLAAALVGCSVLSFWSFVAAPKESILVSIISAAILSLIELFLSYERTDLPKLISATIPFISAIVLVLGALLSFVSRPASSHEVVNIGIWIGAWILVIVLVTSEYYDYISITSGPAMALALTLIVFFLADKFRTYNKS